MKIPHAGSRRTIAIVAALMTAVAGLSACGSAVAGGGGDEEQTARTCSNTWAAAGPNRPRVTVIVGDVCAHACLLQWDTGAQRAHRSGEG